MKRGNRIGVAIENLESRTLLFARGRFAIGRMLAGRSD